MDIPETIVLGFSEYIRELERRKCEEKAFLHKIACLLIGILFGILIGVIICKPDIFSFVTSFEENIINHIL